MPLVQASGVWKYYGDFPALRNISFTVQPGTCTALLGRNGAGKTTLLRLLSGLASPTEGSVLIDGESARGEAARLGFSVIGHAIGVYDELSAEENLLHFARIYNVANPAAAVEHWLRRTWLYEVRFGLAREFSRGMRQRLAIARAFLTNPSLLLLDEPFTSLDDRAIGLLQELLAEALARNATVLLSTHQLREAMVLATDVLLLGNGKLRHAGPRTAEMLEDPGYIYRTWGEAA
jgi:heme exporter protein A